jgi:predicted secreted protein
MKKTFFAMAAILGLALTSCSSDDNNNNSNENKSTFVLKADDLKGNINDGIVTLDPTQTYTLTGGLVVKSGATLVIPAGTTIKSSATAEATSLFIAVERNAKININGTATKPVIMTSGKTTPAQSDWGGLIIAGNGIVNTGANGTSEVGGLSYGGTDNADSSGNINYLKISYTGSKFSATKEYNGVSFFGVGSGTVVSNIYAFESGDDGIEFFGGAVNASNLVIINSYDDSLDFADGWQGTATNVYVKGVTKAGVEGSNNEKDPSGALPMTNAKLVNFSIVKGGATFLADEKTINYKEGGGKQAYTNLYVADDMPSTLCKLATDAGAVANMTAGFFTITNYTFGAQITTLDGPKLSGTTTGATGAGAGASLPTWADWTK